jgi:hypothetical protein
MNNPYEMPRQPVSSDDPIEVWAEVASLLSEYRDNINRDVEDILAKFPDPDASTVAATAYIGAIGENMPDVTIRAAIKKLAANKFRLRGMM